MQFILKNHENHTYIDNKHFVFIFLSFSISHFCSFGGKIIQNTHTRTHIHTEADEIFHFQFGYVFIQLEMMLFKRRSLPTHHHSDGLQNNTTVCNMLEYNNNNEISTMKKMRKMKYVAKQTDLHSQKMSIHKKSILMNELMQNEETSSFKLPLAMDF